jgi:O-antigen/teichoic acid export membrane protein
MNSLSSWSRKLLALVEKIGDGEHRKLRLSSLVKSAATSVGNRAVTMAVSFISVPIAIRYLGREEYGAWVTIGSLLAWLQLTDFGFGNGLTNAITTAAAQDRQDLARMHVSNGFAVLSAIAGCVGLIGLLAWPIVDWSALLNVHSARARSDISFAVLAAFLIFIAQFPLALAGKVYLAFQEGKLGNYWGAATSISSLLALLLVINLGGGLVGFVVAIAGTPMLVSLASNVWVFTRHRPHLSPSFRHMKLAEMAPLSRASGKFFLVAILALVTFQTDNLIITHYLGAAQVPQYSLTYTLFGYASLPQSILFSYLWVAYNEAIARKDIPWVKHAFYLNMTLSLAFAGIAVTVLFFIARPFIGWWAGPSVVPSYSLIGWIAAWTMINAYTNPMACLLASAEHLRVQLIYSAIATAANLALSIYLVHFWGVDGVIGATVISYGVFVCVPVLLDVIALLAKLSRTSQAVGVT